MKKFLVLSMVGVLIGGCLAGCGSKDDKTADAVKKEEKVKVTADTLCETFDNVFSNMENYDITVSANIDATLDAGALSEMMNGLSSENETGTAGGASIDFSEDVEEEDDSEIPSGMSITMPIKGEFSYNMKGNTEAAELDMKLSYSFLEQSDSINQKGYFEFGNKSTTYYYSEDDGKTWLYEDSDFTLDKMDLSENEDNKKLSSYIIDREMKETKSGYELSGMLDLQSLMEESGAEDSFDDVREYLGDDLVDSFMKIPFSANFNKDLVVTEFTLGIDKDFLKDAGVSDFLEVNDLSITIENNPSADGMVEIPKDVKENAEEYSIPMDFGLDESDDFDASDELDESDDFDAGIGGLNDDVYVDATEED